MAGTSSVSEEFAVPREQLAGVTYQRKARGATPLGSELARRKRWSWEI